MEPDFGVKRGWRFEGVRAEKGPSLTKSLIKGVPHIRNILSADSSGAQGSEAVIVSFGFVVESERIKLVLSSEGPTDFLGIPFVEQWNYHFEPAGWDGGDEMTGSRHLCFMYEGYQLIPFCQVALPK